jgi:NADP-dependent aldehyde dehydrogenase
VSVNIDPPADAALADEPAPTSPGELDGLFEQASIAANELDSIGRSGRAAMLRAMASALEDRGEAIIEVAGRETALGPQRLSGELVRTSFQLRSFADVVDEGAYLEATIDHAGPTPMGPRPDLRRMLRPLGPVAVFGASNFPFAFSVPGGDTASALAAGCPVIAKVHEAHPATSGMARDALLEGARSVGVSSGVLGLVFGQEAGAELVKHPALQAVGFTGSLAVGKFLHGLASSRPSPIPFYGELGALNAVVVCEQAARSRGAEIAKGLVGSFTLGVGQFCTKPGLVLVPATEAGRHLVDALAHEVGGTAAGVMLSARTAKGFATRANALRLLEGLSVLAEAAEPGLHEGYWRRPLLLRADADNVAGPVLEECFGPVLVVVEYDGPGQLNELVERLGPALTGTVQADAGDEEQARAVLGQFSSKVGRVVWNGYPTGVAVAWAMHHGGPYPATVGSIHTSVGQTAVRRWLRPLCYQDVPEALLPPELHDATGPPDAVPRRVDGVLILPSAGGR